MLHSVREETKWKTLILEDCCVGSIWTPLTLRERGAVGGGGRGAERHRESKNSNSKALFYKVGSLG